MLEGAVVPFFLLLPDWRGSLPLSLVFLGVMFLAQGLSFLLGCTVVWFFSLIQSCTPWRSSEPGVEGAPRMGELQRRLVPSAVPPSGFALLLGLSLVFGENI